MFSMLKCLTVILFGVSGAMILGDIQCPGFNCTQGGHVYCFHIPCPLPPCKDPVTDPGMCCSHCPTTQISTTVTPTMNCIPIPPCAPPPCDDPVMPADHCCPVCPNDCPHMCKINGQTFCGQPPCPPPNPNCKNVLTPGDCCTHCEEL